MIPTLVRLRQCFPMPTPAQVTVPAADVDLAHHASSHPLIGARGSDYCPDELMPKYTAKPAFIATRQLDVRGADAGQLHGDQCFTFTRRTV